MLKFRRERDYFIMNFIPMSHNCLSERALVVKCPNIRVEKCIGVFMGCNLEEGTVCRWNDRLALNYSLTEAELDVEAPTLQTRPI